MSNPMLGPYTRSITVVAVLAALLVFALTSLRVQAWEALLPFFGWMETTLFGVIGKTWGAAFAVVEAFHLLAMALLGGAVLVSDGRLLGLCFTDHPNREIQDQAHRLFLVGLVVILISGIFMACGVAMKIYYLNVFWYKMLALAAGILFVFCIKRPLLRQDIETMNPWVVRAVAVSSVMVWFTVAATGRWIGFSG
jgi:hypothetical protein